MLRGVDVSDFQAGVHWDEVAASGISFAILKATQGTGNVQDTFAAYRDQAAAAGIAPVGAYAFAQDGDPVAQADHFCDVVVALRPAEFAILDIEHHQTYFTLPVGEWPGFIVAWCSRVEERLGGPVLVYMSESPAKSMTAECARWPLWVAGYVSTPPTAWADWQVGPWASPVIWQWSSTGRVPGINGLVDVDIAPDDMWERIGGPPSRWVTYGWEEVHSYLHSMGIAAADPSLGQSTGGTHAVNSEHYPSSHPPYPDGVQRGHAVDYGLYDGISDLPAIVDALGPLAQGEDPLIVELFWPDGGWSHGTWTGEIDVPNHLHAAIAYGRHLPATAIPPTPPEEEDVPIVVVRPGESVTIPLPWSNQPDKHRVVLWAASDPGTTFRAVLGPRWRPLKGDDSEHITAHHKDYTDIDPDDEELEVAVPLKKNRGRPVTITIETVK